MLGTAASTPLAAAARLHRRAVNLAGSDQRRIKARKGPPPQPCRSEADARTRTADPFITSEVLYQLSYVGDVD